MFAKYLHVNIVGAFWRMSQGHIDPQGSSNVPANNYARCKQSLGCLGMLHFASIHQLHLGYWDLFLACTRFLHGSNATLWGGDMMYRRPGQRYRE